MHVLECFKTHARLFDLHQGIKDQSSLGIPNLWWFYFFIHIITTWLGFEGCYRVGVSTNTGIQRDLEGTECVSSQFSSLALKQTNISKPNWATPSTSICRILSKGVFAICKWMGTSSVLVYTVYNDVCGIFGNFPLSNYLTWSQSKDDYFYRKLIENCVITFLSSLFIIKVLFFSAKDVIIRLHEQIKL